MTSTFVYAFSTAGSDFTPVLPMNLTFQPGTVQHCIDINVTNDPILEAAEIFTVELTTTDPNVTLSPRSAVVTIIRNDGRLIAVHTLCVLHYSFHSSGHQLIICHNLQLLTSFPTLDVVVNIEQPSYTVGEFESSLNVCAVLDRPAERNVTVTLATREEIARGIHKMLGVSAHTYVFVY